MKSVIATLCAAVLCASSTAVFAHPAKAKHVVKAAVIHCPVTGEVIASPKDAYNSEVYKGKTYYFCCAGCKPLFDKDPAKYIKSAAATAKS